MQLPLTDLAAVIRSKNAGPYELTLDVIFRTEAGYRWVLDSGALDAATIAAAYRVPVEAVHWVAFHPARAIKATLRRPVVSGDVADTGVYGAQQHAPLLDLILDLPDTGATGGR